MVKNLPAMWDTWVRSLGWEDPLRRWQYSCLEYSMRNGILVEHRFHRGTWWATVHVVAKRKDTTEQLTVSLSHAFKLSCYLCFALSPAQVGCMRQALGPGALGKPRGSGWRGRWEGGLGWGTHVNPWLFHSNVWQNSLQIKKIKNKKKYL